MRYLAIINLFLLLNTLSANESTFWYSFSEYERFTQRLNSKVPQHLHDPILKASKKYRIPTAIIASIISRESDFGKTLDHRLEGDNGFAVGITQIDKRWHKSWIDSHNWKDPYVIIEYTTSILYKNIKHFTKNGRSDISAAIAAYNAGVTGVGRVLAKNKHPDYATTHKNYSRDVIARSKQFQLF